MKKQSQHRVRRWLYRIGFTILVLISLGLIFNRQIKNWLVSSYQPKVTAKSVAANEKKSADFNFKNAKSLNFTTVAKARMNAQKVHVIGQILVPKAKIHLPIAKGVANETLALVAGTMRADQKMGSGNYPLAGHHMVRKDILFSPLYWKTKVGNTIYLTNMKHVYRYKVYKRQFIAATRVDVVNQTRSNIITLVTCDATGAGRLMIRGKLVQTMKYADAPNAVVKQFASQFNNK
ncbi:class A sortase [Secundilactobacillus similis]|uniref:Sortase (Surface protein transpeptidase) n=1 Tax=Secundilactobacillus similis DSM 23365 = JCM 2765 TaxID=1423804 RepID=A0A0R2F1F4_9LACO|nr:class A sortase [Secundilactobacillus similis]KRN21291.1 sortase (surface protein transpeptidase) [Secundilactobacillus similis DSM 23365 = JCM 2765]